MRVAIKYLIKLQSSRNYKDFNGEKLSHLNDFSRIVFTEARRNLCFLFIVSCYLWNFRCTRSRLNLLSYFRIYFPISLSMLISSSVNGSSGGIPSPGIPLRIRVRNFSRNLLSLNSRPFEATLSTIR